MHSIAIIGIANLFPGSSNPDDFWQNLLNSKDSRGTLSDKRVGLKVSDYLGNKGDTDKFYCAKGGYIEDFEFNPKGFALPKEELQQLDESFQWSLYVAREALRDAGYLDHSQRDDCGVILGNLSLPTIKSNQQFLPLYYSIVEEAIGQVLDDPYFQLPKPTPALTQNPHNAEIAGYPAMLIAKALGLGGAHFSIDAACATSLYAVKLACDYLNSGKANLMLAGAVSGSDPFSVSMVFSTFHAYPSNNQSSPLDKSSEGLFAGEGAGMLVLKRHSDAINDGDHIYGLIQGCGLSNDGKGKFVLSPNPKGQLLAYDRAYRNSGIAPKEVDYIECHATGTMLGDKVEIATLDQFFGDTAAGPGLAPKQPFIGSVKSNVGHLLTAAGMAGIIKTLLSMKAGQIPATINIKEPLTSDNGIITANQIPVRTVAWPSKQVPTKQAKNTRSAGVSSFGFGGCNAHLVLEQDSPNQNRSAPSINSKPINPKPINPKPQVQAMAIIGMDAHFGQCEGLHSFTETSMSGKQHFIRLPEQRWKGIDKETELLKRLGLTQGEAPRGAYIEQFDMDFLHFKIPPHDTDQLIPQQLLLLKIADNAIQDAQLQAGSNVAVLVGMGLDLEQHQYRGRVNLSSYMAQGLNQSQNRLNEDQRRKITDIAKDSLHGPTQINQHTSFIGNIMASRISSLWDFTGPSFTVSEQENTVFRCIEIAQNLFLQSDVEAIVIAAVDLAGSAESVLLHNQMFALNGGKNCFGYERDVTGWMVGEGAGAIVLKRADNPATSQYGNIKSVCFSKGNDPEATSHACKDALAQASVHADQVSYVEVAGSGIAAQDQTEICGLAQQYNESSTYVGSIKASIGHTFAASGIAAIIKTALCLQHKMLPATPNWNAGKQHCDFKVACQPHPWPQNKPYAAINGWGSEGSSAHLILSQGQVKQERPAKNLITRQLIKTVKLGGADIKSSILDRKAEFDQLSCKPKLSEHKLFLESRLQSSQRLASLIKIKTTQAMTKKTKSKDNELIPSE